MVLFLLPVKLVCRAFYTTKLIEEYAKKQDAILLDIDDIVTAIIKSKINKIKII